MERTFDTADQAWLFVTRELVTSGDRQTPRGLPTLDLGQPIHLRIVKPDHWPIGGPQGNETGGRVFRHAITAAEGLSLVGQTSIPEMITDHVKSFRPFLNGSIFWGAYGPRVAGDLGNIVELLHKDPDSRQAVVSIYDSDRDLGRPAVVDVPCTVAIQFRRRHLSNALDMWVMMRSNDAWLGLPYDFGQFALLQSAIAWALGCRIGTYTHSAGSMHLYTRDYDKADNISDAASPTSQEMTWGAPSGGGLETFGLIASRCRRILIGQSVDAPTHLEDWLARQLAGSAPVRVHPDPVVEIPADPTLGL